MREININEISFNPMEKISKEWMLITAGNEESFNTMTASWGHFGSLWGNNKGMATAVIFIRPQRYTKEFVDREERFSLTFFPKEYHKDLAYLGSTSGKKEDKISKTSLSPLFIDGVPCFKESSLTFICRKIYSQPILEDNFIDKTYIDLNYPIKDFHTMYIGAIEKVYIGEYNATM